MALTLQILRPAPGYPPPPPQPEPHHHQDRGGTRLSRCWRHDWTWNWINVTGLTLPLRPHDVSAFGKDCCHSRQLLSHLNPSIACKSSLSAQPLPLLIRVKRVRGCGAMFKQNQGDVQAVRALPLSPCSSCLRFTLTYHLLGVPANRSETPARSIIH